MAVRSEAAGEIETGLPSLHGFDFVEALYQKGVNFHEGPEGLLEEGLASSEVVAGDALVVLPEPYSEISCTPLQWLIATGVGVVS